MKIPMCLMAVALLLPATLSAKQVGASGALQANQWLPAQQRPFVRQEIHFAADYTQRVAAIRIERAFIAYSGHFSALQVCQAYLQAIGKKFDVNARVGHHAGCVAYPNGQGDDRVRLAVTANQQAPHPMVYTVSAVFTVCRPGWLYDAANRICYWPAADGAR